jgi:hypothetical protein
LTNYRVDMVGFVNAHKMIARSAFKTFFSAWSSIRRWGRKWKVEMPIFTSGKGFGFIINL